MEKRILQYLAENDGAKAKGIAAALGLERSEVNSVLYTLKSAGRVVVSADFCWSVAKKLPAAPAVAVNPGPSPGQSAPKGEDGNATASSGPTTEQEAVINAPPTARLMVEAGPGTGKTESLVNRLRRLVGPGALAASNVLVLSFSVAAVRELKTRIERLAGTKGRALAYVDIRTFDSFASRLLRPLIGAGILQTLDYDERILRATTELRTNPAAARALAACKHLLLDEVQDLVGVRADFACELLALLKPGFTLFGDSAQGIYDFQLESGPSRTTSSDLLHFVRTKFPETRVAGFTRNFRAGDAGLQNISIRGRALLLESPDQAQIFLEREFAALGGQGETDDPKIDPGLRGRSTCVVCRTNGQLLQLAGQLRKQGIPFHIGRGRNECPAPAWIGTVFLGWQEAKVRRQPFMARACGVLSVSEADALLLWDGLVAAFLPPQSMTFEISDLRIALTDGIPLPDLPAATVLPDAVQLSTIHRSKGREFENVIVVMGPDQKTGRGKGEDAENASAEPRVLFVALTRARTSLRKMLAKANGERLASERWIRSFKLPATGFKTLSAIEAGLPGDVDIASFAAGAAEDVAESQDFLRERAKSGAAVELWLDGKDGGCPRYRIMLEKTEIGRMSQAFGWAVWHTLRNLNGHKPDKFPARIENLWVREITTAVGDLAAGDVDRALLTSGLWLVPAIEGLGICAWNTK